MAARPLQVLDQLSGDVWVTEDGREIPVEKMADSHVRNALRCFRAKSVALALAADPAGKRNTIQWHIRNLIERSFGRRVAMMEREAARRGLDV